MKELSLSRPGRAYVLAVVAVGGGLILTSIIQLVLEATTPYWVIVAVLTLCISPLSLRVPSLKASVTVTEPVRLRGRPALRPCGRDGHHRARRAVRDGLGEAAQPASRALQHRRARDLGLADGAAFLRGVGVQPLFGSTVGLGQLLVPVLLLTTSYFLFNSVLSATAVWFETRMNPGAIRAGQFLHTALNYFASCSSWCCWSSISTTSPSPPSECLCRCSPCPTPRPGCRPRVWRRPTGISAL